MKKRKAQIEIDMMIWWIIGLAALVLVVILFFYLKSKGIDMIDYLKNLFRGI